MRLHPSTRMNSPNTHRQETGHRVGLGQREQAQGRGDHAAHQQKGGGEPAAADAGVLDQADDAGDEHHRAKGRSRSTKGWSAA